MHRRKKYTTLYLKSFKNYLRDCKHKLKKNTANDILKTHDKITLYSKNIYKFKR